MKIKSYSNMRFAAKNNRIVELDIDTAKLGVIPISVDLDDNDSEPHIIEIKKHIAANAALISAYAAPVLTQAQLIAQAKQLKALSVEKITVTTSAGNTFNGDETSQNRLARAVAASAVGDVTQWKLADNTIATVTHNELKEALLLAGTAMTAIWLK